MKGIQNVWLEPLILRTPVSHKAAIYEYLAGHGLHGQRCDVRKRCAQRCRDNWQQSVCRSAPVGDDDFLSGISLPDNGREPGFDVCDADLHHVDPLNLTMWIVKLRSVSENYLIRKFLNTTLKQVEGCWV